VTALLLAALAESAKSGKAKVREKLKASSSRSRVTAY
jgi:hypothetical protein